VSKQRQHSLLGAKDRQPKTNSVLAFRRGRDGNHAHREFDFDYLVLSACSDSKAVGVP
jgi:hypothetical protein